MYGCWCYNHRSQVLAEEVDNLVDGTARQLVRVAAEQRDRAAERVVAIEARLRRMRRRMVRADRRRVGLLTVVGDLEGQLAVARETMLALHGAVLPLEAMLEETDGDAEGA